MKTIIDGYLSAGGLFNPEMMDHDQVRNMIMELRNDQKELELIREYLWPNQTGLPNKYRSALVAIKARERLGNKVAMDALRAIKREALTCTNGPSGLAHIIRLCTDAGITETLHTGLLDNPLPNPPPRPEKERL